jgi:hypothetical protein
MTTNTLISNILRFGFYLALQILLFRGLVLFNFAFCFVYIGAILALPKEINPSYLIIISFFTGLLVDAFYNTMGMHAAACVLIGYLRPYVLAAITPQQRGYDEKAEFTVQNMGLVWYVTYAAILAAIHHLLIFYLEIGSLSMFFTTLLKVICTVIFTLFMIVILQYFTKK